MTDLASPPWTSPPSSSVEIEVCEHGPSSEQHAASESAGSGSRAARAVVLPIGLLGTTVLAVWIGAELFSLGTWAMEGLLGFLEELRRSMWLLGR